MARGVYPHELQDQDFSWLITSFKENNPGYELVEIPGSAIVFVKGSPTDTNAQLPPKELQSEPEPDKVLP